MLVAELAPLLIVSAVAIDAATTLGLTLLCYDGGAIWSALLPRGLNSTERLACALIDLLAALLIRGAIALLPLVDSPHFLARPGMVLSGLVNGAVTLVLAAKAALALQVGAADKTLEPP